MNSNLIYGLIFTAVGVLTLLAYRAKSERFILRERFFQRYLGNKAGTMVYIAINIVVPIAFGVYFFLFR